MTNVSTHTGTPSSLPQEDEGLNLFEVLTALGEEKWTVLVPTVLGVIAGLVIALTAVPLYTAKTTLLPPQQSQSASSAMLASLGALAGAASAVAAVKAPEELYVALLKSDSVANGMIERFKLRERYNQPTMERTRMRLASNSRVAVDRKSSLISVEIDDVDPAFAAQLANGYAEELRKLMTRLAVTEAQQRRMFFEQQIEKAKNDFSRAELAVKQAQERSGLISIDAQTEATIGTAANLRGQIVAREVELRAMRPYAGPENPELRRLSSELASLRAQLGRIESGSGVTSVPGSAKSDAAALANVRLYRELKFQEAIYSAILQQFQVAKADEAKEAPLLQQVDTAFAPEFKSKPRRSLIVVIATLVGLVAGMALALARNLRRKLRQNPETATQWSALASAWSLRRGVPEYD